jgi:hypothetical protein
LVHLISRHDNNNNQDVIGSRVSRLNALRRTALAAHAASLTIPSSHIGWYNEAGQHTATNPNTLTGLFSIPYRSFYVWQVPKVNGDITAAHIDFRLAYSLGASGTSPQQGELRAMTANKTTLPYVTSDDGAGQGSRIFTDLGNGKIYGRVQVPANVVEEVWVRVHLNAKAVEVLNKSRGKSFGTGIVNVTPDLLDGTYFLMSSGSDPSHNTWCSNTRLEACRSALAAQPSSHPRRRSPWPARVNELWPARSPSSWPGGAGGAGGI